jgi:hypothetical protein
MGKIVRVFIIIAGALLLPGSLALAASDADCVVMAKSFVNHVKQIRAAGRSPGAGADSLSCGHNLQDSFWSPDFEVQYRWCRSHSLETARTRAGEMSEAVAKCSYCNIYARTVTSAAADNIKFGCGFKDGGDKRWTPDLDHHFNGCMAAKSCEEVCVMWSCYDACTVEVNAIRPMLQPIVSQVTSAVAQCKVEKGINTSSSALTVPKPIPPLRDSVGRAKHPGNTSIRSHNDLAAPANRRTTARETAVTEKHDHTPPPARARSRPPNPCKSATATKPCSVGANTSAMDRLSGDSPIPASNKSGEKSRSGGSGRAPAGGGASTVAKPVTAPAAMPKADLTTDFGKCASCGKPPPTPPR